MPAAINKSGAHAGNRVNTVNRVRKKRVARVGANAVSNEGDDPTSAYQTVLVLQGGGALGAFQIGAYKALHEAGIEPDWVIGTSIGAVNAALITGAHPEDRIARLDDFWRGMELRKLAPWLPSQLNNTLNDLSIFSGGVPGFFQPRPGAWLNQQAAVGIEQAAYYDTTPLRRTLSALVDLDRINSKQQRLTVGAVNANTGQMRYFDSREETLGIDHIMASSALPPAFPAVRIDGEPYWDGGIYSNTPIEAVLDDNPRRSSVIFAMNLWPAAGPEPESVSQVMARHKDIQYASRAHSHISRQQENHRLRHIIGVLSRQLPAALRETAAVKSIAAYGCTTTMHVVMLTPPHLEGETATKDIDFSSAGQHARHEAGYVQARKMIARAPWTMPVDPIEGVIVHQERS